MDRAQLLARIGVSNDELERDVAVPTAKMAQAWQVARELSCDPLLGLHAAKHAEYDILDYLFLTSATLGDACRALERYRCMRVDCTDAIDQRWALRGTVRDARSDLCLAAGSPLTLASCNDSVEQLWTLWSR